MNSQHHPTIIRQSLTFTCLGHCRSNRLRIESHNADVVAKFVWIHVMVRINIDVGPLVQRASLFYFYNTREMKSQTMQNQCDLILSLMDL